MKRPVLCAALLMTSITTAQATTDVCAVVLNTPDGFLALREGPGTQFRIKAKLRPSDTLMITGEDCSWSSHGNVTCKKWIKVFVGDQTPISGWVYSRYIQPFVEGC